MWQWHFRRTTLDQTLSGRWRESAELDGHPIGWAREDNNRVDSFAQGQMQLRDMTDSLERLAQARRLRDWAVEKHKEQRTRRGEARPSIRDYGQMPRI
jgi:hypothetical protein